MAKVVGLVGSARGKLGNIVYAVTNGIQVARVYQPAVANPKSSLQNMQRAKGNLAGRVSSFTPKTAITGLGLNARARRSEFLRNILKSASVSMSEGVYTARVSDEQVIFSKGAVPLSVTLPVDGLVLSAYSVAVTLRGAWTSGLPVESYPQYQTRLVAMIYSYDGSTLLEVVTRMATKPTQGETASTSLFVSHPEGYRAVVYAIPMSTADGSAVSINTSMAGWSDDAIAAALTVNENKVTFEYGLSSVLGTSAWSPA